MTTIATDGKIMVADGLGSLESGRVVERDGVKVCRTAEGGLVGVAGDAHAMAQIVAWLDAGEPDKERPEDLKVEVLVLRPGGLVEGCGATMKLTRWEPPAAIGSGGEFAIGAMMAGASCEEAVRVACRADINSGGQVRTFRPLKRRKKTHDRRDHPAS